MFGGARSPANGDKVNSKEISPNIHLYRVGEGKGRILPDEEYSSRGMSERVKAHGLIIASLFFDQWKNKGKHREVGGCTRLLKIINQY